MEVEGIVTANLSWDLSKGPVPLNLEYKVVDHCLLGLLGYGNGANHAILRLVFKHPQIQASLWGPANVQGVTMELEVQDESGAGRVEGQLVVKTFTFTGPHRRACISHKIPVRGERTVSHFINVVKKLNLTPCDFYSVDLDTVGCRDFTSQLIYHLSRYNVLLLPNDEADSVYDIFNWKYKIGGGSKIRQAMHYAAFNESYRHVNIPGCVYVYNPST